MNFQQWIAGCIIFLSSGSLWSFNCYYTLVKDSCWTNYNVSVDVLDVAAGTVITTAIVPAGKSWTRLSFGCQPNQKLMYRAKFSPIFWASDAGKTFEAQNYLSLPAAINPQDTAWDLSSCYPADFSEVPLPPGATGNCQCDFKSIPAVSTE